MTFFSRYDSPIYVSDQMVTNTKTGPEEFTKEIEEHLKHITINAPDFDTLKVKFQFFFTL